MPLAVLFLTWPGCPALCACRTLPCTSEASLQVSATALVQGLNAEFLSKLDHSRVAANERCPDFAAVGVPDWCTIDGLAQSRQAR